MPNCKDFKLEDRLWLIKQLNTGRSKDSVAHEFRYKHIEGMGKENWGLAS